MGADAARTRVTGRRLKYRTLTAFRRSSGLSTIERALIGTGLRPRSPSGTRTVTVRANSPVVARSGHLAGMNL
jgi:hypothetical protein